MSDLAWMGGSGESAGEGAGLAAEVGERIREQEMARRKKISIANKNRVPWNKGRKWSDGESSSLAVRRESCCGRLT